MFFWPEKGELLGMFIMHVHDFIWSGKATFEERVIDKIRSTFYCSKESNDSFRYIGLNIEHSDDGLILHQRDYINESHALPITFLRQIRDKDELNIEEQTLLREPLIYIKFWKQACLPCLLFGPELFSLNKSQLCQLERCQQWFLKNVFYVPKFARGLILLKISNLNSIESEIDLKKLLFWGRLITEPNMFAVVKGLFRSRAASFF